VFGDVSLGGFAGVSIVDGYLPQWGDRQTVMTFTGDRVGQFDAVADLPGVLFLNPIYGEGFVDLEIEAASFSTETSFTSPAQEAIAGFLDDNRASAYGDLEALYSYLDLQGGETLRNGFVNLTPHEAFQFRRISVAHQQSLGNSMRSLVLRGASEGAGGAAAQSMFNLLGSPAGRGMTGQDIKLAGQSAAGDPLRRQIGEGLELFVTAGAIDGVAESTSATIEDADLEGAYAQAGLSFDLRPNTQIGGVVGFASSDTEQTLPGNGGFANGDSDTASFTGFFTYRPGNWIGYGALTYANHESETRRGAAFGPSVFDVQGSQDADTLEAEALFAYPVMRENWSVTPVASALWRRSDFEDVQQSGSVAAMSIEGDESRQAITRLGASLAQYNQLDDVMIQPRLYVGVAHEWHSQNDQIVSSFGATPGAITLNGGLDFDDTWLEVSAEVEAQFANGVAASLGYETHTGSPYGFESESLYISLRVQR